MDCGYDLHDKKLQDSVGLQAPIIADFCVASILVAGDRDCPTVLAVAGVSFHGTPERTLQRRNVPICDSGRCLNVHLTAIYVVAQQRESHLLVDDKISNHQPH